MNRFMGASTFALIASFSVMALSDPTNPFLWFVSDKWWMNITRLLIGLSVVVISFVSIIKKSILRNSIGVLGGTMIIFSWLGLFEPSISTALYAYLKPLDFLIIFETGVILSIKSLESLPSRSLTPVRKSRKQPSRTSKTPKQARKWEVAHA